MIKINKIHLNGKYSSRKLYMYYTIYIMLAFSYHKSFAKTVSLQGSSTTPISISGDDTLSLTSGTTLSTGSEKAIVIKKPTDISINIGTGSSIISEDDGVQAKSYTEGSAVISLTNSGTIESTSGGQSIDFDNISSTSSSTTIINTSTGSLISDDADGIRPGNNATVINDGKIYADGATGDSHDGIDFQDYAGTVINNQSGTISGKRHGITSSVDVNVVNYGTIVGRNGSGIGSDGDGSVVNYGTIIGEYDGSGTGDGDGVDIDNKAVIENYGLIQSTGAAGYDKNGEGNASEAVAVTGGLDLTNYASGVIDGQWVGVTALNNTNNITNLGEIKGTGYGLYMDGNDNILNKGDIQGEVVGVWSNGNLNITNYGSIESNGFSGGDGHAIDTTGNGSVNIYNFGIISSNSYAIQLGYNGTQQENNLYIEKGSSITGLVSADPSNNSNNIFLEDGSVFSSAVGFHLLTASGATTVTGDSVIDNVVVNSGSSINFGVGGSTGIISGNILDNGMVDFNHSNDLTFSNTIEGSGVLVKDGSNNLTLSNSNTYTGGTVLNSGTLTGTSSSFGSGAITDNAALAIAQDTDGTLSNSISGTGTLTKAGSGNVTLAAYDTYTGDTTIENGTLTVSGSIGNSAVTVDDGATLSGTGTVGTTDIRSSGTLDTSANGLDSILHVNGNLTMEQGANYLAVVGENGHSSQTEVNGEVILNGNTLTVNTVGSPILSANSRYQILTASNGVSGTFGTINDSEIVNNYYFLSPTIDYTADSIYLDMDRNSHSFASAAVTRNQYAVGSALRRVVS